MASFSSLPREILIKILHLALQQMWNFDKRLRLRLVNKSFDTEVIRILVEQEAFPPPYPEEYECDPLFTNHDLGLRVWIMSLQRALKSISCQKDVRKILTDTLRKTPSGPADLSKASSTQISVLTQVPPEDTAATQKFSSFCITVLSAIAMLMNESNRYIANEEGVLQLVTELTTNEGSFTVWATKLFEAVNLLTNLHSMLVLISRSVIENKSGVERLNKKPAEVFALITAAREGDFVRVMTYLELVKATFNVKNSRSQSATSTELEITQQIEWYETISATLFVSCDHQDLVIFKHMLNIDSRIHHAGFYLIDFHGQDLVCRVSSSCASGALQLLVESNWMIDDHQAEEQLLQYGQAICAAARVLKNTPGRTRTLQILIEHSRLWNCWGLLCRLLMAFAYQNDIEMARFLLSRIHRGRFSCEFLDRKYRVNTALENPLITSFQSQSFDIFSLFVENWSYFVDITGDDHFIKPVFVAQDIIGKTPKGQCFFNDYLKTLMQGFPDIEWGGEIVVNLAERLCIDCLRAFQQITDLNKPLWSGEYTVGEATLRQLVGKLQDDKIKVLIEEFGITRVKTPVFPFQIRETDQSSMQSLERVQKLMSTIGYNMRTEIIHEVSCEVVESSTKQDAGLMGANKNGRKS